MKNLKALRRAIVYVAWGERHIVEAMQSSRTAAQLDVDRILITNQVSLQYMKGEADFEVVIEHEFVLSGQIAKTEMFSILPDEYGSFCFLDSDTFVLMDIMQGFERAEKFGIAIAPAAHYGLEHFWGFGSELERVGLKSNEILQYNSGVIFFTRSSEAWAVLTRWHELCASGKGDVSAWGDQPYLTMAMEMLNFNPYTLSIAYNYRNFGELASGKIRIWHSHTPPPDDVNTFEQAWPPRRFLAGKRLEDGVS